MRVVPSWTQYFFAAAVHASSRSKDPYTQVGAVLVRDNNIFMTGYNGFVPGALDCPEHWDNRDEKYPRVIHAEMNAIAGAARMGMATKGATLYVTHFPCLECAKLIAAAGIGKVVYDKRIERPGKDFGYKQSQARFDEAGIEVVHYQVKV